jgi:hypothetical protein
VNTSVPLMSWLIARLMSNYRKNLIQNVASAWQSGYLRFQNDRLVTGPPTFRIYCIHTPYKMSSIASSSRSALRALPSSSRACARQVVRPATIAAARLPPLNVQTPRSRSFFSLNDISKLASNLTGSNNEGDDLKSRGVESDGESQSFHARKILP